MFVSFQTVFPDLSFVLKLQENNNQHNSEERQLLNYAAGYLQSASVENFRSDLLLHGKMDLQGMLIFCQPKFCNFSDWNRQTVHKALMLE